MKNIIVLFLLFCGLMISCLKTNCDELSELYRNEECLLILKKQPSNTQAYLSLEGVDIETGEPCECKDTGRWWVQYRDYMSVGDTIIKRKGELIFNIHKKDTLLSFPWKCEGKVYN